MASLEFDHFIGLNTVPSGILVHPNGQNYIYAAGGNVVIADLTDTHFQQFLRRHDDSIECLAISKSGKLVASGQRGLNADAYVWNFETRELLFAMEEHDNMVCSVDFSQDEKLLVTLGSEIDGKMIVWDMSNGYIVCTVNKLPRGTNTALFCGYYRDVKRRDTKNYMLATAGLDGVTLWNLGPFTGEIEQIKVLYEGRAGTGRQVVSLALSDDRETLFAGSTSGDYAIVSLKYKKCMATVTATKMTVHKVVSVPNRVLLACGDGSIKCYSHDDGRPESILLNQMKIDGTGVISIVLTPDGRELLALTLGGTVSRVSLASFHHLIVAEHHTQSVVAVACAVGCNDKFATASLDGTVRVWDAVDYNVLVTIHMQNNQPRGTVPLCLTFSSVIISGWSDGRILAHDSEDGKFLWFIDNAHLDGVTSICLAHNSRFVLSGGVHGELRLWEMRSRELISHLKEHNQKVTSIVLFPDDLQAVSCSRDRNILRWDLRQEKRIFCQTQRMGGLNSIVLSNDAQNIVSIGQERKIICWGINEVAPLRQVPMDFSKVDEEGKALSISHCGRYLATGSNNGMLRLWSASFKLLSEVLGHSSAITCVQFTPDDKQILSAGEDGTVFVWCVFIDEE